MELQSKLLKHMSVLKDVTPSGPSGCVFCSAALVGFSRILLLRFFAQKPSTSKAASPTCPCVEKSSGSDAPNARIPKPKISCPENTETDLSGTWKRAPRRYLPGPSELRTHVGSVLLGGRSELEIICRFRRRV